MNRVHILGDGFEDDATIEHVATAFRQERYGYGEHDPAIVDALTSATFVIACYEMGDWSGQAYVLYQHDGKLYEVEAGHCSCYGLEGQWEPVEVARDAVLLRVNNGKFLYDYNRQIKELIVKELA